ncbi:putative bifunctional diguanylate cyclase/phosphodiesterase [Ahrensia kielensis]|uniref:putative bifunctional diguanylate cyclase/phosphodiesterase n=1 Tax=Ahrensia kielensis TaxID=76980 RepID=UPI00036F5D3F|nr:EAL domain-containing protein [Ahrensia kielensis]
MRNILVQAKSQRIEDEAYVEFVNSLFGDTRGLLVGGLLQATTIFFFLLTTGVYYFSIFIVGAIGFALWRARLGQLYQVAYDEVKSRPISVQLAMTRQWEHKYVVPGTLTAINIGLFCYFGFQAAEGGVSIGAVYCLLFAPVPTIVGRLYGSMKLASFMLFGLFGPIILGFMVDGSLLHILLALLCLPYIVLVLSMVKAVRGTVVSAVEGNADKIEIGRRFDVALKNMAHGLMMFDDNNRILIANEQARKLFDFPDHLDIVGRHFSVLMRFARRFDGLAERNIKNLDIAFNALLGRVADRRQVLLDDGRYLELAVSERSDGGTVLTFEDISDRVQSARKIERMAQYDSLTNLPNRQYFETMIADIAAAAKPDEYCALLVVDVDDFKHVNDAVGHAQGDALLRSIASLLSLKSNSYKHLACRLGGDEFLFFICGVKEPQHMDMTVAALNRDLCRIHDLKSEQVYVSCSIGYVTMKANEYNHDDAIVRADLALYAAKDDGKGTWREFEKIMDDEYQRRQRIKNHLAKAVQADSLSIVYQPLVDAHSGRLVSCEALSRWHDDEYGNVSPAEYIPLAEEMGIVTQISGQMLRKATMECAKWPDNVSVSVNLSPVDFRTGEIVSVIKHALSASKLPAHRLEIEITETAVISNEREMIGKLRAIRDLGVRIALDDFGTGHSSLSYLHRLPLHKVKIDRSFVVGIDTGETPIALLHGVTELCRTLGLDVTVEGVETEEQLALVISEGKVDRIQGYVYGPGLPSSGILTLAKMGRLPTAKSQEYASA